MLRKSDIETTFEKTVAALGGNLVWDLLTSKSPSHENADFIFRQHDVVCELKILEHDPNELGAIDRKAQKLFDEWMDQGRLLIFGKSRVESVRLPYDMQWELAKLHSEAIKRVLKKANRQIRETKVALNVPSAKGHVVVVNDATSMLDPYSFAFSVHQSLGKHFSNINGVSVVSVNYTTTLKGLPTKLKLWLNYARPSLPALDETYLGLFAEHWARHVSDLEGVDVPFVRLPDTVNLKDFGPLTRA